MWWRESNDSLFSVQEYSHCVCLILISMFLVYSANKRCEVVFKLRLNTKPNICRCKPNLRCRNKWIRKIRIFLGFRENIWEDEESSRKYFQDPSLSSSLWVYWYSSQHMKVFSKQLLFLLNENWICFRLKLYNESVHVTLETLCTHVFTAFNLIIHQ